MIRVVWYEADAKRERRFRSEAKAVNFWGYLQGNAGVTHASIGDSNRFAVYGRRNGQLTFLFGGPVGTGTIDRVPLQAVESGEMVE